MATDSQVRLAGFVGGRRVELATAREVRGKLKLEDYQTFASNDFSGFNSILRLYLKRIDKSPSLACLGVAGPVIDDEVTTTNLPWHLTRSGIEEKFELSQVVLLNDVVATAHGIPELDDDRFYTLNSGTPVDGANQALVTAGAGLGEAIIFRHDGEVHPQPSEGGHACFAPTDQLEAELWEYLYSELGAVTVEDVVSLQGLENIYHFLTDTRNGQRAEWYTESEDRTNELIEKALSGEDELASQTLDIYVGCLASEVANFALNTMAIGGIFIGGRVPPRILTALDDGRFLSKFIKRGKMESLLRRMPVGVVIEDRTPLLGAARLALNL